MTIHFQVITHRIGYYEFNSRRILALKENLSG